jgi:hypothetical protein
MKTRAIWLALARLASACSRLIALRPQQCLVVVQVVAQLMKLVSGPHLGKVV